MFKTYFILLFLFSLLRTKTFSFCFIFLCCYLCSLSRSWVVWIEMSFFLFIISTYNIFPIFTFYVIGILAAPKTFFFFQKYKKLSSSLVRGFSFSYYFRCPNGKNERKKFFLFLFWGKCCVFYPFFLLFGHFGKGSFSLKILHFYNTKLPGKCYPKNGEANDIIMK